MLVDAGCSSSGNIQTLTEPQSSVTALLAKRRHSTHWHPLDIVLLEVMWFAQKIVTLVYEINIQKKIPYRRNPEQLLKFMMGIMCYLS